MHEWVPPINGGGIVINGPPSCKSGDRGVQHSMETSVREVARLLFWAHSLITELCFVSLKLVAVHYYDPVASCLNRFFGIR